MIERGAEIHERRHCKGAGVASDYNALGLDKSANAGRQDVEREWRDDTFIPGVENILLGMVARPRASVRSVVYGGGFDAWSAGLLLLCRFSGTSLDGHQPMLREVAGF